MSYRNDNLHIETELYMMNFFVRLFSKSRHRMHLLISTQLPDFQHLRID